MKDFIEPRIRIEPYCVFCHHFTEWTGIYDYYDSLGHRDRWIRIHFPGHRFCFYSLKILRVFSLFLWIPILLLSMFPAISIFSFPISPISVPIWKWCAALIASVACSLYLFVTIHHFLIGRIHLYYVLKEELPEADKTWRRKLNGTRR